MKKLEQEKMIPEKPKLLTAAQRKEHVACVGKTDLARSSPSISGITDLARASPSSASGKPDRSASVTGKTDLARSSSCGPRKTSAFKLPIPRPSTPSGKKDVVSSRGKTLLLSGSPAESIAASSSGFVTPRQVRAKQVATPGSHSTTESEVDFNIERDGAVHSTPNDSVTDLAILQCNKTIAKLETDLKSVNRDQDDDKLAEEEQSIMDLLTCETTKLNLLKKKQVAEKKKAAALLKKKNEEILAQRNDERVKSLDDRIAAEKKARRNEDARTNQLLASFPPDSGPIVECLTHFKGEFSLACVDFCRLSLGVSLACVDFCWPSLGVSLACVDFCRLCQYSNT